MVIVWVKLEYSEWCVVKFRKKHSLSSGDVTIASVLASIDAIVSRIQVGPVASVIAEYSKVIPRVK